MIAKLIRAVQDALRTMDYDYVVVVEWFRDDGKIVRHYGKDWNDACEWVSCYEGSKCFITVRSVVKTQAHPYGRIIRHFDLM